MGMRARTAVLAAIAALAVAPAAGYGQAAPAAPPAGEEQRPEAGGADPGVPAETPPARIIPLPPDVLPGGEAGPGRGGRDCEHERSPGIGV
jgi:hypothetical protein